MPLSPFKPAWRWLKGVGLTLSLPIFWQLCSLCATFILSTRGVDESQAYKSSEMLFVLPFLSITFNNYSKFEVSMSRILWTLHNVCKRRNFNKVRGIQVTDRRRWQSAMTSPIGDVGSERVKGGGSSCEGALFPHENVSKMLISSFRSTRKKFKIIYRNYERWYLIWSIWKIILKEKINVYSLWMVFDSKMYCL